MITNDKLALFVGVVKGADTQIDLLLAVPLALLGQYTDKRSSPKHNRADESDERPAIYDPIPRICKATCYPLNNGM